MTKTKSELVRENRELKASNRLLARVRTDLRECQEALSAANAEIDRLKATARGSVKSAADLAREDAIAARKRREALAK